MSSASEQLCNGYLRRNMPTIVSKVKVRDIIPHLPCLSAQDKETIEAKREAYGNYDSMVLLLDCLKKRENWPDQFIGALEACEREAIAAEIRAEYEALKGSDPQPDSPPTTVVKAHIHPAPPATHLSVPESGADAQTAATEEVAPEVQEPVTQVEVSENPETCVTEEVSSAVPEPPKPAEGDGSSPPTTPPPSPVTPHHQPKSEPVKEEEAPQEQENSESDVPDFTVDFGAIPDQVIAEPANSANSSPQPPQVDESDEEEVPEAPTGDARSPSPPPITFEEPEEESFHVLTPEKSPVQDSVPALVEEDVSSEPEDTSEPPDTQVDESVSEGLTQPADVDISEGLEEPGITETSNHIDTLVDLSSDNNGPLETGDLEPIIATPICAPVLSEPPSSPPPCQENGLAIDTSKPEEIHEDCLSKEEASLEVEMNGVAETGEPEEIRDESLSQGEEQDEQETAEEPSLLISQKTAVISINGKTSSGSVAPGADGEYVPSEQPEIPTPQKTSPRKLPVNTKYILTAAGVGACALLMAWRFKH